MKTCVLGVLSLLCLLVLSGCFADCGWGGTGLAWLDENGDGRRDPGEPPLENVRFVVDDTRARRRDVCEPAVSDAAGTASFSIFMPGCPEVAFQVRAEPPAGYLPTTPQRLAADEDESGETFSFGFAYQPGLPTPTPRPAPALACTTHVVKEDGPAFARSDITAIEAGADGTLWVATNADRVVRFDAGTHERTTYCKLDGIPDAIVRALAVAPDGSVWLATNRGAARFDGVAWRAYRHAAGGGRLSMVSDVAVAPGGRVWLVTDWNDVSRYNPATDGWETDVISDSLLTSSLPIGAVRAPTGRTVWFFGPDSIYELLRRPTGGFDWIVYKRDADDRPAGLIWLDAQDAIAAPDDVLWLSGQTDDGPSIVRWEMGGGWTVYNHRTTGGALYGDAISGLALAPDGSLWVSLATAGVLHFTPGPAGEPAAGTWLHYTPAAGLPLERIDHLAVAPDGAVWLGGDAAFVARCVEAE